MLNSLLLLLLGSLAVLYANPDHESAPRKALLVQEPAKGNSVLLKVAVMLNKEHTACPRKHRDLDQLREFVADSFASMLDTTHVTAKIKTGILGCAATVDDDGCTRVAVEFVLKLHPKKHHDSSNLSTFIEVISGAPYSKHSICDSHAVACTAHEVTEIEVEQMDKKPHGTKLYKYKPHDEEDDEDGDKEEKVGQSFWESQIYNKNMLKLRKAVDFALNMFGVRPPPSHPDNRSEEDHADDDDDDAAVHRPEKDEAYGKGDGAHDHETDWEKAKGKRRKWKVTAVGAPTDEEEEDDVIPLHDSPIRANATSSESSDVTEAFEEHPQTPVDSAAPTPAVTEAFAEHPQTPADSAAPTSTLATGPASTQAPALGAAPAPTPATEMDTFVSISAVTKSKGEVAESNEEGDLQQESTTGLDMRLWPDSMVSPWSNRARPIML